MSDYEVMCSTTNLRRAYRWLLSDPDFRYKNLFRDSYSAYAIASDANLRRLRNDLRNHRFQPSHASKVFVPKPSGVLRPLTLLTVDDQIVYQACVNIIADKIKPVTKHRYRKRVFNHLYAGKSSAFFYLKWQDSYRMLADKVRSLVHNGYVHVANFDLTSFYDSIDHHVLSHFLGELGIEEDLIDFLMENLRVWTSLTWSNRSNAIYLEHGIPQGPLPSGMLSEVILMHLDKTGERGSRTHYLRYVDDIKLFARREEHLRQKLIGLDICSKEIGLFPQTSKINIRRVRDPEEEIKSVSRPPEPSIGPFGSQHDLRRRILEITKRGRVSSELSTRFKYLLGHAVPYHTLNLRLLNVLQNHPEHSEPVSYYFSRCERLPGKAAEEIIEILNGAGLYHSVHADLLRATLENMQEPQRSVLADFCYQRLFRSTGTRQWPLPPQPTYKEALIAWVIRCRRISFVELEQLRDNEIDWWIRKSLFRELQPEQFGSGSFKDFVNDCLHLPESEIARCAAAVLIERGVALRRPYGTANSAGKLSLRAAGLIRTVGRPDSMINAVLHYVLKRPMTTYDWRRLLGPQHKQAERIAILVKQKFEVDIDACIVRLDSLCDLVFEELVRRYSPSTNYAHGSILNSPSARLRTTIPNVLAGFKVLHDLRVSSLTAHPRLFRTGGPTRRLKHSDYRRVRPQLISAFDEIESSVAL